MGIKIASLSEVSGFGEFVKPAEYATTTLIIVEPKSWSHNANNQYNGNPAPRDEVEVDLTVFDTEEDLKNGTPSKISKGALLTNKGLSNPARNMLEDMDGPGGAFLASRIVKRAGANGSYFAWDDPIHRSHVDLAAAYLEAREAEVAAALDDVPGFD